MTLECKKSRNHSTKRLYNRASLSCTTDRQPASRTDRRDMPVSCPSVWLYGVKITGKN